MSELSEEDIKRLWFVELLNKNGADTGVNVEEVFEKLTGETMKECECECECANISTKRIYNMLLQVQEKILQNNIDKKEIISTKLHLLNKNKKTIFALICFDDNN